MQTPPVRQTRVLLAEPDDGWSRGAYDRALDSYVGERGRPPQTVTMHPETATMLGLSEALVDPSAGAGVPMVITSLEYARQTITLYY
jgi:hypothetical protein